MLVSFDGGSHRFNEDHRALLPLVDVCIVAGEYATAFTGAAEPEAAAPLLLQAGPSLVVVTNGTAGSHVVSRSGEAFHQPACRVEPVVDTTGAGDAYHGAFLFGIARGLSPREAARYASAAGALNTGSLGGRAALPTLPQIERFLADNP